MPEVVDEEFKEHYQELIRSSLLRSVQTEGQQASWPAVAPAPAPVVALAERDPATRRSRLKLATKIIWLVAVVLLVCDALAFGVYSWATGLADVGVLVLTVVLFLVSSGSTECAALLLLEARVLGELAARAAGLPGRRAVAPERRRIPWFAVVRSVVWRSESGKRGVGGPARNGCPSVPAAFG